MFFSDREVELVKLGGSSKQQKKLAIAIGPCGQWVGTFWLNSGGLRQRERAFSRTQETHLPQSLPRISVKHSSFAHMGVWLLQQVCQPPL